MPSPTFAQMSPQMNDPYNIETPLVQGMTDPQKSAISTAMLNLYRSDRGLQQAQAGETLNAQHEHARAMLQAQIQKNIADTLIAGGKENLLPALTGTPALASMFQGYDRNAYDQITQRRNREVDAGISSKIADASAKLVESGNPYAVGEVSRLIGAKTDRTLPQDQIVAQIGASASGGEKPPTISETYTLPSGDQGSVSGRNGAVVSQVAAAARARGEAAEGVPPAQRDRNAVAVDPAVTSRVHDMVARAGRSSNPDDRQVAAEIKKNYAGNSPQIRPGKNGGIEVRGNGRWIPLPNK